MADPKLLLLDEPLSALDAQLRIEMRTQIRDICKQLRLTVVFVTHDQQEAVAVADRIALMSDGMIIQYGPPNEFYTHPNSRKVAEFFGWKNFITGMADSGKVSTAIGDFPCGQDVEGEVCIAIRPDAAVMREDGKFIGNVMSAEYMGTRSQYLIGCEGTELYLDTDSRYMYLKDDTIRFDIDTEKICVMKRH